MGIALFVRNMRRLRRNIRIGTVVDTSDHKQERLLRMLRLALGQGKMGVRPVAGLLHLFVYVGFIVINIEVLEILIDGIFPLTVSLALWGLSTISSLAPLSAWHSWL